MSKAEELLSNLDEAPRSGTLERRYASYVEQFNQAQNALRDLVNSQRLPNGSLSDIIKHNPYYQILKLDVDMKARVLNSFEREYTEWLQKRNAH